MRLDWPKILRQKRAEAGLGLEAMAKALDISKSLLSRCERGFADPPEHVQTLLSKLYKICLDGESTKGDTP